MEPTLIDRVLGTDANYLTLAGPFFLALAAVEVGIAAVARLDAYRLNDSVADLSCGIFDQILKVFGHGLLLLGYVFVYERWALFEVAEWTPAGKWLAALLLFLGVDCCFYWQHRFAHLWAAPWAAHVVHHQSEEFNLTVALRQSAFEEYLLAAFYLPLALVGFPPKWYIAMFSFNLIWQFWCHTRLVGRLGPLEWVFNTPSHHRVHHGRNARYLDKNYAGTLIIWDRLFGTFEPEGEEVVYGITRPFRSWNPVWANFHYWAELAGDAWRAPHWWDKVRIWFMPLGWRPRGLPPKPPVEEVTPATQVKYDARVPAGLAAYVVTQYALTVVLSLQVLNGVPARPLPELVPGAVFVVASLVTAGGLFERKAWAFPAEVVRLLVLAGGAVAAAGEGAYLPYVLPAVAVAFMAFLFWLSRYHQLFTAKAQPVPEEVAA
jgi:sterol desaturase/sphingolipid hydroxylase (fatty acid hydroxylase superfamily)